MKQLSINSDFNAFLGGFFSGLQLFLIAGFIALVVYIALNPDWFIDILSSLGSALGEGLIGLIVGGISGLVSGLFNTGEDIANSSGGNWFSNALNRAYRRTFNW